VVDWAAVEPGIRLAALGGITIHFVDDDDCDEQPPPPPSPESGEVSESDAKNSSSNSQEPLFLPLAFELLDPEAGALHDLLDDLELHKKRRRTALAALAEGVGLGGSEEGGEKDGSGEAKGGGGGRSKGMLSRARWWKASSPPPRLHQDLLFPLAVMEEGHEDEGEDRQGSEDLHDGRK